MRMPPSRRPRHTWEMVDTTPTEPRRRNAVFYIKSGVRNSSPGTKVFTRKQPLGTFPKRFPRFLSIQEQTTYLGGGDINYHPQMAHALH